MEEAGFLGQHEVATRNVSLDNAARFRRAMDIGTVGIMLFTPAVP